MSLCAIVSGLCWSWADLWLNTFCARHRRSPALLISTPPLVCNSSAHLQEEMKFSHRSVYLLIFFPEFNTRVEEYSVQRIQRAIKYLNDWFRRTLTCALCAQTNLNEHHFVRFRFFSPGLQIRPNTVGKSPKSKALLKDQFGSPPGLQGSSCPIFQGAQRAAVQESGPARSPVQQGGVETSNKFPNNQ